MHGESSLVTEMLGKSHPMKEPKASSVSSIRRPALAAIPQQASNSKSVGQDLSFNFLIPEKFEVPPASFAHPYSAGIPPHNSSRYSSPPYPGSSSYVLPITPNPSTELSGSRDDVFGPLRRNGTRILKRKSDPDWACTRTGKRSRLHVTGRLERQLDGIADSMCDTAKNTSTAMVIQRPYHYGRDDTSEQSFPANNLGSTSRPVRMDEAHITTPAHHLGLSPDLITACILLEFKYSAD